MFKSKLRVSVCFFCLLDILPARQSSEVPLRPVWSVLSPRSGQLQVVEPREGSSGASTRAHAHTCTLTHIHTHAHTTCTILVCFVFILFGVHMHTRTHAHMCTHTCASLIHRKKKELSNTEGLQSGSCCALLCRQVQCVGLAQ